MTWYLYMELVEGALKGSYTAIGMLKGFDIFRTSERLCTHNFYCSSVMNFSTFLTNACRNYWLVNTITFK